MPYTVVPEFECLLTRVEKQDRPGIRGLTNAPTRQGLYSMRAVRHVELAEG